MSTEPATIIKEVHVLPSGVEATEDNWDNLRSFVLSVQWRGPRTAKGRGGYGVNRGGSAWLSRAGKWGHPENFQQRQYRWETLEEALEQARAAVDSVQVMGRTYAQWEAEYAARAAARQIPSEPWHADYA